MIKRVFILLASVLAIIFYQGCATIPDEYAEKNLPGILPEESSIYFSFNLENNKNLAKELIKETGQEDLISQREIDTTKHLYISVIKTEEYVPVYSVVASGVYPKGIMDWNLFWDKNWIKKGSEYRWWENRETGIQISIPGNSLICVSNGKIENIVENLNTGKTNLPVWINNGFNNSDMAVFLPEINKQSVPFITEELLQFPIRQLYFSMNQEGQYYKIAGIFLLEDEKTAKIFSSVFKLLLVAGFKSRENVDIKTLMKDISVNTEGMKVLIEGVKISSDDFIMFLKTIILNLFVIKGQSD